MYPLDERFCQVAAETHVIYTRYADDITLSGNSIENVLSFEKFFADILRSTKSPSLTPNNLKRGVYLRGQRRMVTGLIITPSGTVSIGRERKRLISVMLHKALMGRLATDRMHFLKGMLGFCIANEPDFVSRMRVKYGDEIVNSVMTLPIVRFK
jgi:RNA-directed DNA polymerase